MVENLSSLMNLFLISKQFNLFLKIQYVFLNCFEMLPFNIFILLMCLANVIGDKYFHRNQLQFHRIHHVGPNTVKTKQKIKKNSEATNN